jgi:TPR repeat protein
MPKIKLPRKIRDPVKKANGGCGEAAFKLSRHYAEGSDGVENDVQIARQWLFRSAELGNADAQVALAVWHKNAGENDFARTWWEKAAAQGSPDAAYNLGVLYDHGHGDGLGVEERTSTAAGWYLKAASKGMREAQNNYGRYLESTGHHGEAMTWYEKAAAQEHAGAMHNIAMMYLDGVGSERNLAKAREWWTRAAELGYEKANECLKETEGYGHDGLLDGLVKKANDGCRDAAWKLASHYYYGTGGVENKELSRHWVERAAELGHVEAQAHLASMLRSEGDYDTARKLFEKAAAAGSSRAEYGLGLIYWQGCGVPRNVSMAVRFLRSAASKGILKPKPTTGSFSSER